MNRKDPACGKACSWRTLHPVTPHFLQAPLGSLFHSAFCSGVIEAQTWPREMSLEYTLRQGGVVTASRPHGVTTTEQSRPSFLRQLLVATAMAPERSSPDAATPETPSGVLSASDRQLLAPDIATLQSFWPALAQLKIAERLAASWVVSCHEAPQASVEAELAMAEYQVPANTGACGALF